MQAEVTDYMTLRGGEIRVYSLSDNKPGQKKSSPILIVPGWGESADVAMILAEDLYDFGNNIFVIEYGNLDNPRSAAKCDVKKSFPLTEKARACVIVEFLNSQNHADHIVAHSQGAIAAMLSTTSNAKNIGTIILIAPAGIILLSLSELVSRFIKSFFIQLYNAVKTGDSRGRRYFSGVSHYIGGNPLQLGRDAYSIANINLIPLLVDAKMENRKINIICNEDDRIFPIQKMRESIESLYVIHSIN